jgi:hypothetical protein
VPCRNFVATMMLAICSVSRLPLIDPPHDPADSGRSSTRCWCRRGNASDFDCVRCFVWDRRKSFA